MSKGFWDIVDWGLEKADKYTPQIMLTVKFTTKTPPKDTSDVVKLTKDENAVYVKCIIENQGQTDIPQIKIQKHTLHCKPLYCKYNKHNNHKQKYKHIFYIKMPPASRKLNIMVQNSHNKKCQAIYDVTYYPQSNTTNIASDCGFIKYYIKCRWNDIKNRATKWWNKDKKPRLRKKHQGKHR